MKRNIDLFLWALVLLGLVLSLGFQLYRTGLPLVREKAKMALILAIEADLKRRVTESDLFYSYLPGKPEGKEVWGTDDKGICWTAILHGEWSNWVVMVHLSLIAFSLAFLVWKGVFSSYDSVSVNTVIKQVNGHCWQMGNISFDSDLGTIIEKGGAIHSARSQVNELLALFLATSGHQLSVDKINEEIWTSHGGIVTTDSKNRLISDLRKFLKESQVPYQIKKISSRCYQLLPKEN